MTYKETEILIQKYLNAETSPEEERQLALEVSADNTPQEWKIIAEMLGELTVDEALFDQIMEERKTVVMHKSTHKTWPWIAAACIAGVMLLIFTPPKQTDNTNTDSLIAQNHEDANTYSATHHDKSVTDNSGKEVTESVDYSTTVKEETQHNSYVKEETVIYQEEQKADNTTLLAENTSSYETNSSYSSLTTDNYDLVAMHNSEEECITLTESGIPITHPENFKYTKEEIALMQQQADEAYLKRIELELEISKFNLEQTIENR